MTENKVRIADKELQKEKIRKRYKGADIGNVKVIPSKKIMDFYDDVERRVAVYVRVSTNSLQQTSSYELQKNYYEDKVSRNEKWTLVDIYADEGISGTSLNHRDAFNRMITDCRAGKIDMIMTKSVSRFSRNIRDCITIIDELNNLKNPVGVYFETEGIFSLKDDSEMSLHLMSTIAQEESHIKSAIMNASVEMRFSHGILLTPVLLGYDHDENGALIINKEEAKTIRLMFFMYLYGYTCQQIADTLTQLGRQTKKGNIKWTSGTVLNALRNERYCGNVLARKTYTPRYLDHKSKKNNGERTQYLWSDMHEEIISKSDFIAVQHLLNNVKYGNKGILPELKVISDGALKGFVSINPRWSGFKKEDYLSLSESVCKSDNNFFESAKMNAKPGEYDFRGFEIARSQFFNTADKLCMTFSASKLVFSAGCIKKFSGTQFVEMFVHPNDGLIAVRMCESNNKNAIKWVKPCSDGKCYPRYISGMAFLDTLFEMFGWKNDCKYRIRGIKLQKEDESVLLFNTKETEIFVDKNKIINKEATLSDIGKWVIAYPSEWVNSFGNDFYCHLNRLERFRNFQKLNAAENTTTFSEIYDLNITSSEETKNNIKEITDEIKENTENE